MSVYHHIRQLAVKEFFQTRSDFPRKLQKLVFICFHRVTKTHQDKIAALNTIQCVSEWLSLQNSVLLYHHITAPLQVQVSTVLDSPIIIFSVILKYSTGRLPAFHC